MKTFQLIEGTHDLTFIEQLRVFISRQGWTVEELGKRLGVTDRQVRLMLSGQARFTEKSMMILYVLKDNPKYFDDLLEIR